jgi:hypothetical protein
MTMSTDAQSECSIRSMHCFRKEGEPEKDSERLRIGPARSTTTGDEI